jgi:SPP1 gp7 family putative phage head morphogenesis protein
VARDWEATYAERTEAAKAKLAEVRALAVYEPPTIEAKAVTGPGAFAMTYHTPLHAFSRDPHRLMAEAEALYVTNGWVGAAERTLAGRFLRMKWHLEDPNGKTIDSKSPEAYQAPLKLLQRPSKDHWWSKLAGVTFRHIGLPGNAIWYLDQRDMGAGTPLELLYINPARMTPAVNEAGRVVGWVLDHPDNQAVNARSSHLSRQGVPLSVEEVIHFTFSEPDWGVWGVGIAESAQRKIELDRLAEGHTGGVLASGGRLSGLVSPKAGSVVNDDQWAQFVRDWRSITSDPDAAKRLQIAKMPLDFTQMTASPKELQLTELTNANRDTIFGLWGVPVSERGFAVAAGLNSDLSTGYKETLWETVKERAEPMRETIQYGLLDRWQALDVGVTLVFEYPTFEDNAAALAAVEKTRYLPLTNNERRDTYGLEPLPDPQIGDQVWMDKALVRVDEVAAPPEPQDEQPTPPGQSASDGEDEEIEEEAELVEGKADLTKPLLGLRQRTETTWEPKMRRVVNRVLREQQQMVAGKLEHAVRKHDLAWWNAKREDRRFMDALDPVIAELARHVAEQTQRLAKKPEGKADTFLERVLDTIRSAVGARISGINATTLEKVQAAIAAGVEVGEGPRQIGQRLEEAAAFDEYRAELISRTETAQVYNDAALQSYGALEVAQVQAIDGDTDAECAARNGKVYPIDEAMGISDHPNGTLDWIPVI